MITNGQDFKVTQVAAMLIVHPETMRRMAKQGVFPRAFRSGPAHCAQVRIPWADFESYRAKQPKASR